MENRPNWQFPASILSIKVQHPRSSLVLGKIRKDHRHPVSSVANVQGLTPSVILLKYELRQHPRYTVHHEQCQSAAGVAEGQLNSKRQSVCLCTAEVVAGHRTHLDSGGKTDQFFIEAFCGLYMSVYTCSCYFHH